MLLYYREVNSSFPNEKQWWLTSFNSNYLNVHESDLVVVFALTFNDSSMFQAFKNKYGYKDSPWTFDYYYYSAILKF